MVRSAWIECETMLNNKGVKVSLILTNQGIKVFNIIHRSTWNSDKG